MDALGAIEEEFKQLFEKQRLDFTSTLSEEMEKTRSDCFKELGSDLGLRETEKGEACRISSVSEAYDSRAEDKTETDRDTDKTDLLLCIMKELKLLRKEMQETRHTVKDEINQMKQHLNKTMNSMFENFEKQVTSVIQKVEKQSDNVVKIRDEVKGQAECIERQTGRVHNVEIQLDESVKREKLTKTKLIHMDAKERKNNLMFFGVPEVNETTTCEETLQRHIKDHVKVATPCHMFDTKRLGLRKDGGAPRPIVTSFADPVERMTVWGKRHNLSQPYGLSEDFPPQIRKSRTLLVPEMKRLRKEGKNVGIRYPAELWCDNKQIRSIDIADISG